ncbi:MAG TPA: SAM-dependent methyltransferase, partial [Puia sp.]
MLYLVPSPIGNLQDITFRSLEVLKKADLILAEDTRNSLKLLNHYQIIKPLTPYH